MDMPIVIDTRTGEYGLLTCDYGVAVFVPIDGQRRPTGAPGRHAGIVGPLAITDETFIGLELSAACTAAGFRWEP